MFNSPLSGIRYSAQEPAVDFPHSPALVPTKITIRLDDNAQVTGAYDATKEIGPSLGVNIDAALKITSSVPALSNALELLTQSAVHPTASSTFRNPLYANELIQNNPGLSALIEDRKKHTYINEENLGHHPHIGKHVLAVSTGTLILSHACGESVDFATEAARLALLHDASKLAEELEGRIKSLKLTPEAFGYSSDSFVQQMLMENGITLELANEMDAASVFCGHKSLKTFLQVNKNGELSLAKRPLSQLILHLVDDMTSETKFLAPQDRMNASNFPGKYKYLWSEGLGYINQTTGSAQIVEIKDLKNMPVGVTPLGCYADIQVATAEAIALHVMRLIQPDYTPIKRTSCTETLRDILFNQLRTSGLAAI